MPALSPTMTEGNIATWKLKEGDSFSAGDVILEIETDKATMDVEAQDDGVLFKILASDGAKQVQVGQRIAVLAEQGDDLSSLEVPADDLKTSTSQDRQEAKEDKGAQTTSKEETSAAEQQEAKGGADASKDTSSGAGDSEISKPLAETPTDKPTASPSGQKRNQNYPLYPSVEIMLHQNGLSSEDAHKISATGPQGRILKGDVLAYLGKINKEYPAKASERLEKLTHLDLSNIQLAKPQPKTEEAPSKPTAATEPELPSEREFAIPISLSAVIATQKRVQDTLGIFLPLSTFIARASELANEDLPASAFRKPTADDLFNAVLGLDQIPTSSRGYFIPQVTGISPAPPVVVAKSKKPDIIDLLAPKAAKSKVVAPAVLAADLGVSAGDNVFSVIARKEDERRAEEYLDRLKLVLEKEPGRLVL